MLCHWGDDAPAEEKGRLAGYGVDSLGLPDSPSWDKTILADGFRHGRRGGQGGPWRRHV